MKRVNNIYDYICDINNIELADKMARRGKHNYGIIKHDATRESDNKRLSELLKTCKYKTSKYDKFKIYEPKERIIYRLPYYPDRIAQWSIMVIMEPIWTKLFINNTYSCIKGRGIHKLNNDIGKVLDNDKEGTTYCLKLDVKKFYPSIDNDILKYDILRRKIKDKRLLTVLDEIIDSEKGVPIGNYLSQFFANLYLTYLDHWLKEEVRVKYYFRYADDIVILHKNKDQLKKYLILIKIYLHSKLKLDIKDNYQVFPVQSRGIDFVGYVFYHGYTKIRKNIKHKIFKLINKYKLGKISYSYLKCRLMSYFGWLKYCNSKHLLTKIQNMTGIHYSNWNSKNVSISKFRDKTIRIIDVVNRDKYSIINFVYKNKPYSSITSNKDLISCINKQKLPLNFKIFSYDKPRKN